MSSRILPSLACLGLCFCSEAYAQEHIELGTDLLSCESVTFMKTKCHVTQGVLLTGEVVDGREIDLHFQGIYTFKSSGGRQGQIELTTGSESLTLQAETTSGKFALVGKGLSLRDLAADFTYKTIFGPDARISIDSILVSAAPHELRRWQDEISHLESENKHIDVAIDSLEKVLLYAPAYLIMREIAESLYDQMTFDDLQKLKQLEAQSGISSLLNKIVEGKVRKSPREARNLTEDELASLKALAGLISTLSINTVWLNPDGTPKPFSAFITEPQREILESLGDGMSEAELAEAKVTLESERLSRTGNEARINEVTALIAKWEPR